MVNLQLRGAVLRSLHNNGSSERGFWRYFVESLDAVILPMRLHKLHCSNPGCTVLHSKVHDGVCRGHKLLVGLNINPLRAQLPNNTAVGN
jgi:hypothetical protein